MKPTAKARQRFGVELQQARARLGWTQREAAEQLGMSNKTLSDWEPGKVSRVQARTLSRFMRVYMINPYATLFPDLAD